MAKLEKDKIALFLACASVLSGQTSAMNVNKAQSPKTVAAVGGAAPQVRKGMPVGAKVLLGIIGGASVIELIHSGFGFFTNSILGKYSLGELAKKALDDKKAPGGKKEDGVELPVDNNAKKALAEKILNIIYVYTRPCTYGYNEESILSHVKVLESNSNYEVKELLENVRLSPQGICSKLAEKISDKVNVQFDGPMSDFVPVHITYNNNKISFVSNELSGSFTLDEEDNLIIEANRYDKYSYKLMLENPNKINKV